MFSHLAKVPLSPKAAFFLISCNDYQSGLLAIALRLLDTNDSVFISVSSPRVRSWLGDGDGGSGFRGG